MNKPDFEVVRTMNLTKNIHYAGESLSELHFREAEAELLDIVEVTRNSKHPKGESLPILSWFTGVGIPSLKRLNWRDTQGAMVIIGELTDADFDDDDDVDVHSSAEESDGEKQPGE